MLKKAAGELAPASYSHTGLKTAWLRSLCARSGPLFFVCSRNQRDRCNRLLL